MKYPLRKRIEYRIRVMFDPNARPGQYLMISAGAAVSTAEGMLAGIAPNLAVLAGVGGLLVIPPFTLPARGFDVKEERVEKFFLTFGPSFFLGILAGIGLAGGLSGNGELREGYATLSGFVAFMMGTAVCLSYWSCGHMSREFLQALFDFMRESPAALRDWMATLKAFGFHKAARDIGEAFLQHNHARTEDRIKSTWVLVMECVTNAISEPDAETGKEWISDLDVAFELALRANRLAQMDLRREHVQAKAASA